MNWGRMVVNVNGVIIQCFARNAEGTEYGRTQSRFKNEHWAGSKVRLLY